MVMAQVALVTDWLYLVKKAVLLYDAEVVRVIIDRSPLPSETARAARDEILREISSGLMNEQKLTILAEMGGIASSKALRWPTTTASTSMLLAAAVQAWGFGHLGLLLLAVKSTGIQLLPKVSKAYAASALVAVTGSKLEDSVSFMHTMFDQLNKYGWLDEDMKAMVDLLRPCAGQENDII